MCAKLDMCVEKLNDPNIIPCGKVNCRWIVDLNSGKIIKVLEENVENTSKPHDLKMQNKIVIYLKNTDQVH